LNGLTLTHGPQSRSSEQHLARQETGADSKDEIEQALDTLTLTAKVLGLTMEQALRGKRSVMIPGVGDAGKAGSIGQEKSASLGKDRSAEILDDLIEQLERAGPASSTSQNDGLASASTSASTIAGSCSGGSASARKTAVGEGGAESGAERHLPALESELEALALERDVALVITLNP
jgi:hypothetical protein